MLVQIFVGLAVLLLAYEFRAMRLSLQNIQVNMKQTVTHIEENGNANPQDSR